MATNHMARIKDNQKTVNFPPERRIHARQNKSPKTHKYHYTNSFHNAFEVHTGLDERSGQKIFKTWYQPINIRLKNKT